MLALANYSMKGPMQANIAVVLLAALSAIFSPIGILVGAVIALVTLRVSTQEGLKSLLLGLATTGTIHFLMNGGFTLAVISAIEFFIPVWILSVVLRSSNSLEKTLEVAVMMCIAVVAVFYTLVGSPSDWWLSIFNELVKPVLEQANVAYQSSGIEQLANIMTMLVAVFLMSLWYSIVLLGRWWQGTLYYPGQFQQDFYQLSLSKQAVYAAIAFGLLTLFIHDGIVLDISSVITAAFMFQGLAIAHHSVNRKQASTAWLFGIYVLLILLPQMMLILATIGVLDYLLKIRERWS